MEKKCLAGINKVRFWDFSLHEEKLSRNGGCYGFWTDYSRTDGDMWEISHGTTADMEFCPVCGHFGDHYEGDECIYESGYSCGEYEVISEGELLSIIEKALEEDSEDKEIKFMDESGNWTSITTLDNPQ